MPCSILIVNENLFAIGGDDGHVTRKAQCAMLQSYMVLSFMASYVIL